MNNESKVPAGWSRTLSCLTLDKALVRLSPYGVLKNGLPKRTARTDACFRGKPFSNRYGIRIIIEIVSGSVLTQRFATTGNNLPLSDAFWC